MTSDTTKPDSAQPEAETAVQLFDNWFDPIETGLRARVREFIEALIRGELDAALARPRYGRRAKGTADEVGGVAGHRHGSRTLELGREAPSAFTPPGDLHRLTFQDIARHTRVGNMQPLAACLATIAAALRRLVRHEHRNRHGLQNAARRAAEDEMA